MAVSREKSGRLGGAVDGDSVELTLEIADRREDAAEALDGIEVGVVEGVVAGHGRVAGIVGLPRSKGAGGVDFAARDGIGERRVIAPGRVRADIVQLDVL